MITMSTVTEHNGKKSFEFLVSKIEAIHALF